MQIELTPYEVMVIEAILSDKVRSSNRTGKTEEAKALADLVIKISEQTNI